MLDDFIRYLEAERRYSPLTVRNYRHDLELFLAWLDRPAERATTDELRSWVLLRAGSGRLSPASINRELSSLRSFFRWMHRTGRMERDIARTIPSLKAAQRLPAFVPESRMKEVVDTCTEEPGDDFTARRDALVVLLFYTCGVRLAELVGIDRDDLSEDLSTLRVRGKGDRERQLPLLPFVRERIAAYLRAIDRQKICINGEKALFLTGKGGRISRSVVYRLVRRELAEAGVQGKKSPHVLRHTFATHLMNGGADMREIQELMGHASLQATQVYTHNSIARLREIYATAHPREREGE